MIVRATVVLLDSAPEVPVMVTVAVPDDALLAAVKVTVLLPEATALNAAVTPEGRPEAVNVTAALNPFCAAIEIALVALVPELRLTLAGLAERVKLGGAAIVSIIVALLLIVPDVPVTVTVELPGVAFAAALKLSVLVCAVDVVDAGLNAAVTPDGSPETERVTLAVKPLSGVTVMVLDPLAPCVMLTLAGDAEIV